LITWAWVVSIPWDNQDPWCGFLWYENRDGAHADCFNTAASIGILRKRLPVAAKIALAMAGTIAEVPHSPIPPGTSRFSTMCTSTAGASFMRSIW
jgi:hypothetical protein